VKQVVTKLVKKLGKDKVKKMAPESEHSLIDYIEKMIRREIKEKREAKKFTVADDETKQRERLLEGEPEFEDDSDYESSDEDEEGANTGVKDTRIVAKDIPLVRNLKVAEPREKGTTEKKRATIETIMDIADDEYNPHFASN